MNELFFYLPIMPSEWVESDALVRGVHPISGMRLTYGVDLKAQMPSERAAFPSPA